MANLYIYSTMSSDNCYAMHEKLPNGLHKKSEKMVITGKANVTNPKTLMTPLGMMTVVDEAEFKKFEDNSMLKRHIERGFIKVTKAKGEADAVAKDMTGKDKSAQLTEEDTKKVTKKGK